MVEFFECRLENNALGEEIKELGVSLWLKCNKGRARRARTENHGSEFLGWCRNVSKNTSKNEKLEIQNRTDWKYKD